MTDPKKPEAPPAPPQPPPQGAIQQAVQNTVAQAQTVMAAKDEASAVSAGASMRAAIESANAIGDRNALALMNVGGQLNAAKVEIQRLTEALADVTATCDTMKAALEKAEADNKTSSRRRRSSKGGK